MVNGPKSKEKLSKVEFDAMMQAGYDDALADRSEDVEIVFSRIRKRIAEQQSMA